MNRRENKQKKQLREHKEGLSRFNEIYTLELLTVFFSAIEKDGRINTTHLGIFVALLSYSIQREFMNPIKAFSYQIMPMAKVLASSTYHKHVKELSKYGYIKYVPSFKKNKPSSIYIVVE